MAALVRSRPDLWNALTLSANLEIVSSRQGRCYLCKSKQQSARLLPTHRDAMAIAPVGVIVPQRMVLRAAVVPKCNRIRRPLEAHAQLRGLNVPIEHFENRVAFTLVQADDVRSEEAIHEQTFFTCLGVCPNNWMLSTRIDLSAIVITIAATIMLLAIVDRREPINEVADRLRQHFVSEIHVCEHGVATAVGGHFGKIEDRAHRRLGVARYV